VTPKVGPHQTYSFAPGSIYGNKAQLVLHQNLVTPNNENVEYLTAMGQDGNLYVVLLNVLNKALNVSIRLDLAPIGNKSIKKIEEIVTGHEVNLSKVVFDAYGTKTYRVVLQEEKQRN
jgi:hypothetical protein